MFKNKINKFALILLLFAVAGFLSISLGGEFLHNCIHHHTDQASTDQCSFSLLQTQVFLAILGFIAALLAKIVPYFSETPPTFSTHSFINLPNLRAPPVFL